MLDACLVALHRRGLRLPPPIVVADSWLSDSKWMKQVATHHQGTLLVGYLRKAGQSAVDRVR